MFGHLKAEDFVTAAEGSTLSTKHREHLASCSGCTETLEALQATQSTMAMCVETDIPEPVWSEFRDGVRSAMLSRSVQRDSAVRRWTGWPVRPAMAWVCSVVFAVGLTAALFTWTGRELELTAPEATLEEGLPSLESLVETSVIDKELTVWSQTGVFDELVLLNDEETESLRTLLEGAMEGTSTAR